MNTPNNKRRKESVTSIEKVFINLLQSKELNEITVTAICQQAHLNRSTFYANYFDVYDLAEKVKLKLEDEVAQLYADEVLKKYNSNDYLKLFYHIRENQLFYKTYFKLGFDNNFKIVAYDSRQAERYFKNQFIDYHITFFKNGLNAIIKLWLHNGCKETPEEINSIIKSEYANKKENQKNSD